MTDDPNSVADALERRCVYGGPAGKCGDCLKCTAARLLRESAGTADRLAATEQAFAAAKRAIDTIIVLAQEVVSDVTVERDDLASQLAAAQTDLDAARAGAESWVESARTFCSNEVYWRDRAEKAEARLSALTAAINGPQWLEWWTGALADIPETLKIRLVRIADALAADALAAAAVQPPSTPDNEEPT